MKHLRNKILVFILLLSPLQIIYGQIFGVDLVKDLKEKEKIISEITKNDKNIEVVKNLIVYVSNGATNFLIAPVISTEENSGGCYLQYLNENHQIGARYLIEKNEDVQSCDAIIAIFGCHLPKVNGIGVMTGIRLGSNNYYEQSSFFDVSKNSELTSNPELSKKIVSVDSVAKAKRNLGCFK